MVVGKVDLVSRVDSVIRAVLDLHDCVGSADLDSLGEIAAHVVDQKPFDVHRPRLSFEYKAVLAAMKPPLDAYRRVRPPRES